MLTINNITKILAISMIMIGFVSGSFLQVVQSSCCCGTIDNCCCCAMESLESNPENINDKCSCEIEEADPPLILSLESNNYSKPEYKTVKMEPLPRSIKSPANYDNTVSRNCESVRNSGPPIFLSVSSLLI